MHRPGRRAVDRAVVALEAVRARRPLAARRLVAHAEGPEHHGAVAARRRELAPRRRERDAVHRAAVAPQRPHELRLLLRGLAREFEQIIDALGGPAVAFGERRHSLMFCAATPVRLRMLSNPFVSSTR